VVGAKGGKLSKAMSRHSEKGRKRGGDRVGSSVRVERGKVFWIGGRFILHILFKRKNKGGL